MGGTGSVWGYLIVVTSPVGGYFPKRGYLIVGTFPVGGYLIGVRGYFNASLYDLASLDAFFASSDAFLARFLRHLTRHLRQATQIFL